MTLTHLSILLKNAKTPKEVFGDDAVSVFQSFVKICHPDVNPGQEKLATETYESLLHWRSVLNGTATTPTPVVDYAPITLSVNGKDYEFTSLLGVGSLSTVHRVKSGSDLLFAKVSNHHKDNDLLENEYKNLSLLHSKANDTNFSKVQSVYIPKPVTSFLIKNSANALRRVNILSVPFDSDILTLRQLSVHSKFTGGIDRNHLYWMLRRTLLTLQLAHDNGIVHGISNPDHWLIYPKQHGIVLLDWTASCSIDKDNISYLDPAWNHYYSFYKKEAQSASLDNRLAVLTFLEYIKDLPNEIRKSLSNLLLRDKLTSAQAHFDIGQLIDKFDGPRKFTPLEV